MEILYKVGNRTFADKKKAEEFEHSWLASLVNDRNKYKHFYLPSAFEHYKRSLEKLKDARAKLRIKSFMQLSNLRMVHEDFLSKRKTLKERTEEYKKIKALIDQLSTDIKQQKNKKTESKK